VLVTGASGFIARRCLEPLVRAGYDVHAVSSRAMRGDDVEVDARVRWHKVDLLDIPQIGPLISSIRPSHLLHAAWIATPGAFWASEKNVSWLLSSVELVRQFFVNGGTRALGVGTCAEYEWGKNDCREGLTPVLPSTPYGQCKAAACFALEAAAGLFQGTWAWARLFLPYGPGEPQSRLIPSVICALLRGDTVELSHGAQVRDFVYIDDVADALVKILSSNVRGAINVGSGVGLSLRDVVALITARLGGAGLVRFGARPTPAGDPARVVADIGRLERELGWQPAFTTEAGIDHTIAAWRARLV